MIFGRFGLHLGAQVGAMLATFCHKTATKSRPNAQDTQDALQTPPGSLRTSILAPLGLDFGAPRRGENETQQRKIHATLLTH